MSKREFEQQRERVQELVTGIARSGKWIDESMDHRMQAAGFDLVHDIERWFGSTYCLVFRR